MTLVSWVQVTPHCPAPVSNLMADIASVFICVTGDTSKAKLSVGDTVGSLHTMSTANWTACRFPLSQALRSTAHVEQQVWSLLSSGL
jgi:hypothetical protein